MLHLANEPYTIFIYRGDTLVFWSNDKARYPDFSDLSLDNPHYQDAVNKNYYRLITDLPAVLDTGFTVLAFVPIQLASHHNPYKHIDPSIPPTLKLKASPGLPILQPDEKPFIYIDNTVPDQLTPREITILTILYLLAILALAVLIQRIAYLIRSQIGIWPAISFFVLTTVGIRLVSLLFDFSGHFEIVRLFDPAIMAPGFTGSLSDLLINIALFLWVSVFIINSISIDTSKSLETWHKGLYAWLGYLLIINGLIFLANFCRNLIQNTSINFNFESVFSLDQISILALIGIILLMFSLFIWSTKIVSIIQRFHVPVKLKWVAGILALAISLPLLPLLKTTVPMFQFALVAGIYLLLLDIFLEVKTPNFTWVVLWLVVLSGFSSILLFKFNKDKDIAFRKEIAVSLIEDIDTVALREIDDIKGALDDVLPMFDQDSLIQSFLMDFMQKSAYLSSYYEMSFTPASALNKSDVLRYGDNTYYRKQNVLDHYLFTVDGGNGVSVVTSLRKKQNNPYAPLKSLLPIQQFKGIRHLAEYDYAIYEDLNGSTRCIERSHAGYNMILEEAIPEVGKTSLFYPSGRSELIVNNGDYIIIVGRRLTGLIKPVSLFSYLFVVIVLVMLALLILNTIFPYLPSEFNFTLSNQISLRNKIQVSVLALIILSFVIIGIVTVIYFQNTAQKGSTDRLEKTASSLQYELQQQINSHATNTLDSSFIAAVDNLSIKYNSHIQLYNEYGLLVTTSDQRAFEKGYLSDRMNLASLIDLKKNRESIDVTMDRPGQELQRSYVAYFSLMNKQNTLLGFVGLPIHPADADASGQVKDFMGTLLNVYVFLLLIAGAFALAVANSITRPLTVLGQKLKEFKLGKSNEPLEWKTKDEVGILIQEYNQMIVKLDESADLLALTEREMAWREMAKQVAHEIKNPLTPMRLSIQHLQHAMQNADPIESRQLVQRVGITLIEQIDNLSRIAAEFSTFAKMPKPQNEKIILNDLVASVHDLFKKRDDMDFNLYVPIDEIYVNADKSHLLRVLNNLIKNAIQAIPASRKGVIDIKLEKKGERAVLQVKDNGKGISKEMREKVFYPNFTTKTSGTGLGLAISKNIIESFGGRIYFETEENIGTTFYFELPLMKNTDHESPFRLSLRD